MKRHFALLALLIGIGLGCMTSVLADEASKRDPFWPIGFRPAGPVGRPGVVANAIDQPELVWPEIPVQGRSRGDDGRYFVLIRGIGVVTAGEEIAIRRGEYWFHWRIAEIDEAGIRSIRLGVVAEPPTTALIPRGTGR